MAKRPDRSPRSFIFSGGHGTGKTSCARIFARVLNCDEGKGDICGACSSCMEDISNAPYYMEFDSSDLGVDDIRGHKERFLVSMSSFAYRVVVYDESHTLSAKAQASLLKTIEEMPQGIFAVFCSTDVEKLLPTIRSRSLELPFISVPPKMVRENLLAIAEREGMVVSEKVVDQIVLYADGHMRDAVNLLDLYRLSEDEATFQQRIRSSEDIIIEMLKLVRQGEREEYGKRVEVLPEFLLARLRSDFYNVIYKAVRQHSSGEVLEAKYVEVVELWQGELFKLLKYSLSTWVSNAFQADNTAQSFFWSLYGGFSSAMKVSVNALLERSKKK